MSNRHLKKRSSPRRRLYLFRRERDGKIIRLGWKWVMAQDAAGYITLPNGDVARRCAHLEPSRKTVGKPVHCGTREIVSNALGFPIYCLDDAREHLKKSGCGGVEFRIDPDVPQFVQVVCENKRAYDKYARACGFIS